MGIVIATIIGLFTYNKINAEEVSGNFSLGYNSDISFRGASGSTSAIQGSMGLGVNLFGLDVGVGAFTNVKQGLDNEVQLSAETGLELWETLQTSVGLVTYDNNNVLGDATEAYVDIGAEIILSPTMRVYYEPSSAVVTLEGSVSQELSLTEAISFEAIGSIGNTELANERATYYSLDVIGKYDLGKSTDLFVAVDLTELKDVNLAAPDVGFYVGVTHSF